MQLAPKPKQVLHQAEAGDKQRFTIKSQLRLGCSYQVLRLFANHGMQLAQQQCAANCLLLLHLDITCTMSWYNAHTFLACASMDGFGRLLSDMHFSNATCIGVWLCGAIVLWVGLLLSKSWPTRKLTAS